MRLKTEFVVFLLRTGKKAQMMEECGEKQPRDSGKLTKKKSSGLKERKAAAKEEDEEEEEKRR